MYLQRHALPPDRVSAALPYVRNPVLAGQGIVR